MVIQRKLACESKCVSSSCIGCLRNSRNTFAFAGLANAYLTSLTTPAGVPFMPLSWSHNQERRHSRPQSLRSFWPAAGIERFWEQPFQACAIDEDFVKPDGQNSVISFVFSKWLLPELSIPAAGQKDRRLWGREWGGDLKDVRANCFCASLLRTQIHMPRHASSARAKY